MPVLAGQIITADDYTADIDDLDTRVTALESSNPKVSVARSGAQTIPELTGTAIAWNSENWDIGPEHSGSSTQVIAAIAGIEDLKATIVWEPHTSGYRKVLFRVNGISDLAALGPIDGNGTEALHMSWPDEIFLSEGDFLEVFVYFDSGGAVPDLDVIGARMSMRYVGTTT